MINNKYCKITLKLVGSLYSVLLTMGRVLYKLIKGWFFRCAIFREIIGNTVRITFNAVAAPATVSKELLSTCATDHPIIGCWEGGMTTMNASQETCQPYRQSDNRNGVFPG